MRYIGAHANIQSENMKAPATKAIQVRMPTSHSPQKWLGGEISSFWVPHILSQSCDYHSKTHDHLEDEGSILIESSPYYLLCLIGVYSYH